jgi:outer membrane protein assembly factor BamB
MMDSGSLKAFSTEGTPLWTYFARGRISPYLTRSPEGTSYIARTNGIFIAVNRVGRELWRTTLPEPLSGPVVCGWDGRLFIPSGNRIYCLTASGHLLWERDLVSGIAISPIPDYDGGIVLVLNNAVVLRIGPFGDLQGLYVSALPKAIVPMGTPGDGGRLLIVYPNGGMEYTDFRSVNFDRGPVPYPRLESRPLTATGWDMRAAILLEGGQILGLNGLTGETLWSADSQIGRATGDTLLRANGQGIYALSQTGATGFTSDGRMLWHLDLTGAASVPGFGDDGVLYSGGADWILYAFKQEEQVRQNTRQSLIPEGAYGTGSPPPSSWAANPLRFGEAQLENQLTNIRQTIAGGRVENRELEYTAYLMETANAGQDPETSRYRPLVNVHHRVRALQLLALIGSQETIPFLARIFSQERDPTVKAAAAEAIGAIGMDPDGIALRAFTNSIFSPNLREEQVMVAVAAATGAVCRFSGPPVSDTGIRILTSLTTRDRPQFVQALAKRELETLGK